VSFLAWLRAYGPGHRQSITSNRVVPPPIGPKAKLLLCDDRAIALDPLRRKGKEAWDA
jgi:hypothetical protein